MNVEQTYQDLQNLSSLIVKITARETGAINELNRLHKMLFGAKVVASCSNCHIKAYHMLTSLTMQKLIDMNAEKFKLKKDVMIEYPYRSGVHYSSALGITDAKAVAYLREHPEGLKAFATYPGSDSETKALDLSAFEAPQAEDLKEVKAPAKAKAKTTKTDEEKAAAAAKGKATKAANKAAVKTDEVKTDEVKTDVAKESTEKTEETTNTTETTHDDI